MDMFKSKYIDYFHDGGLISIKHEKDSMDISMDSAEVDPEEDIEDDIPLGELYVDRKLPEEDKMIAIKGTLHIKGIQSIHINDELFLGILSDFSNQYDSGGIFDFCWYDDGIELDIKWHDYPPKPRINDFSTIIIRADEITWEYIPDLPDSP